MKEISSRAIIGMMVGWAIAFEGFFALSISNPATIQGIGGISGSTFFLAAIQLTFLGIIVSAVWTFKITMPRPKRRIVGTILSTLTYLSMALVALEGLAMVFMAGDVFVTGFGGVSKKYIVLIGAQLFALGILSLRLWRLREVTPANWLVDALGSVAASLLMLEGLTAMGIAGNATIQGFGGILERTVYYGGAQLVILGAFIFFIWTIVQDPLLGPRIEKFLTERRSMALMAALGGIVALEGVIASTVAGTVMIEDIGGASKIYVVAGCAQLFVLGLMAPLLWNMRQHELNWKFLSEFISPVAMTVLAFEGVFAMGLAANTNIVGIGVILESTFRLAGAQLLFLSLLGLVAILIKDSPLLGAWSRRIVTAIPIMTMGIIGLEGLAAAVLAANIWINDFSGVGEKYVLIGGAQLTILSALALISWARSKGISTKFKVTSTVAAAFVMLMLPIAITL